MIMIINFLNAEVRKRMLVLQVLEVYYLSHENLCFGREIGGENVRIMPEA